MFFIAYICNAILLQPGKETLFVSCCKGYKLTIIELQHKKIEVVKKLSESVSRIRETRELFRHGAFV